MAAPSPLSADSLIQLIRTGVEKIADHRAPNASIPLADVLMSALAMFSLKDSSLLEFDERRGRDDNLKRLYGLATVPCDTQMRTVLWTARGISRRNKVHCDACLEKKNRKTGEITYSHQIVRKTCRLTWPY